METTMKLMKQDLCRGVLMGISVLMTTGAMALTASDLERLMADQPPVVVVDVRDVSMFQQGHIPSAINVPIRLLPRKTLPPLGRVVIYGRGLGEENMEEALRAMNAKQGIQAELLDGGYAVWKMNRGLTTQAAGLQDEIANVISYQGLQNIQIENEDMVLVDLRRPPPLTRQSGENEISPILLAEQFPGKIVVKSPFDVAGVPGSGTLARQSDKPLPLMVLIDDGDGKAQEMERVLRANGVQRVVVLAGGELILERDGMTGLQRMGAGMTESEGADDASE